MGLATVPHDAGAQVAPGGLNTRVNGTALGRCVAGVCTVQGGATAGGNVFHRFSQFDTRSGIKRVDLDTRGRRNVVVGVSHASGSFFDAPLRLSQDANLFWLSPGGIWLGQGAHVQGATNLLLTTAASLRFGHQWFDALGDPRQPITRLDRSPSLDLDHPDEGGGARAALAGGGGPIVLDGGRLTIDRHLLLDSGPGPILSPAGGNPLALRAGGSVRLSGGRLDLGQLTASAGSTAEPGLMRLTATGAAAASEPAVRLRQARIRGGTVQLRGEGTLSLHDVELGAVADQRGQGGDLLLETGSGGAAQLRDATLRGQVVAIRAEGALDARNVVIRAGDPTRPGAILLQAGGGATPGASLALEKADLEAGEIQLRSAGSMALTGVRAVASPHAATGRIGLEAGMGDASRGTIHLRQVRLTGSDLQVAGSAGLWGEDVAVLATPPGREGTIGLLAGRDGQVGRGASLDLRGLLLRGDQISLQAPAGLKGQGWTVEARGTASTPGDILLLTGTAESSQAGGPAILTNARLSADRVRLRAGGGYRLQRVAIQAGQGARQWRPEGLIQLDTGLAPSSDAAFPERPVGGRGHLDQVDLAGQRIVVLAGEGLGLRDVSAQAGRPGERGLVWLETGAGSGMVAPLTLTRSRLEGQQLLLRASDLTLSSSQLGAPKGVVHLEARGPHSAGSGNLRLAASTLDVGVGQWEDLIRDLRFVQVIDGVEIVKYLVPSIGLFASGGIEVSGASQLTATQDFNWMRADEAKRFPTQARLADTSGVILLDADQSVRVKQSTLRADATHTLAGDVVLRAKGTGGSAGVRLEGAMVSASGGAGAGDIRLRSSGGLTVEGGSVLEANAPLRPTTSLFNLYGGGGITLVNDSPQIPIWIHNSKLIARQFTSGGVFSPFSLDGGTGKQFDDPFDDADRQRLQTQGGAITLLSTGGIRIEGPRALLAVDSQVDASKTSDAFGGVVRLINTRQDTTIAIVNKATLRLDVKPVVSTPEALAGKPELHIWTQGPILLEEMRVSARNGLAAGGERFNPLITVTTNAGLSVSRSQLALTSTSDAGVGMAPNLAFFGTKPEAIQFQASAISSGRQVFSAEAFVRPISPEQFEEMRAPAMGEAAWHNSQNLYLITTDGMAADQWLDGGEDVAEPLPNRIALQATPQAAAVRVFRPGQEPLAIEPLIPGLQTPQPAGATANPLALVAPPRPLETALRGTPLAAPGPPAPVERTLARAGMEASPPLTVAGASGPSRALTPKEAEDALVQGEELAAQSLQAALGPAIGSKRPLALPTLQEALRASTGQPFASAAGSQGVRGGYAPAILRINVSPPDREGRVQVDQILIPAHGEIRGWRTQASRDALRAQIKTFQRTLSQQLPSTPGPSTTALAQTLLGPVLPDLERLGVNALLLSLDRELQSIPFSALPLAGAVLGDRVALTVTPTLRLTDLAPSVVAETDAQTLLAGATRFRNGLAPLPMARQELEQIAALLPGSPILLDEAFNLSNLRGNLRRPNVKRLHLATHADFRVDDAQSARLFMANGELNLSELGRDLQAGVKPELDLVVLSACRTALGDEERELGIAGLALQTGSASALGTLWYVDDVAAAAFSIQFHRFLRQGLSKDLALQATQKQFRRGAVRVMSDRIVNAEGLALLSGLSRSDQVRLEGGLGHPYYWAGMVLSGRPW